MNTLGYVFLFVGALVIRAVSKGRGLSDIPGDLGDAFTAVLQNDPAALREVLGRTTDLSAPDAPSDVSANLPPVASGTINTSPGNKTQADLIALGKRLQAQGFQVSEGPPPFGPISPNAHAKGTSYHYKMGPAGMGLALDINWPNTAQEPAKLDTLASVLVMEGWEVAWRTAGHYDHLHVDTGKPGRLQL